MHALEETSPTNHKDLMTFVFDNHSKETAIYPLTVLEISEAQTKDKMLDKLTSLEKYNPQLIEDVQVLCKDGKLVIPKELQKWAVEWYHHYLQHPGTICLEETLCVLQCVGKAYGILSLPTSKSAINVKSTKDASKSTVNYLQS